MKAENARLLETFEACEIENWAFRHGDHLLVAWLYLRRDGPEQGAEKVIAGIKRFAAAKGVPEKYHHTETRFWIRLMTHVVAAHPETDDFETVVARVPHLLDKYLPLRHYRRETIVSPGARARWTEPDLLPLPF